MNDINEADDVKPSVLVVDDDQIFADVLARALGRRGYEVRVENTAAKALATAELDSPEFIVLDLKLGNDSGLPLVAALKAIDAETKIVVLTGYASIATAIEAIKLGATHYLAKPTDVETIIASFSRENGDDTTPINDDRPTVDRIEWEYIQQVLADNDGNISATARTLKMHRRTLQRKLGKRPARE